MVRTKQVATSRFGGRTTTPSISSSSYFYGAHGNSQPFSSGVSSQSQHSVNINGGLVDYSSQFSHKHDTRIGAVFPSLSSVTSGVLTQSQDTNNSIIRRPKPAMMHIPKLSVGVRKRKYRPGTRALMEIKKLQKTCCLLLRRAPFLRVVKDMVRNCSKGVDYKIQSEAVNALQEASEAFLVTMFEAANMCAIHGKRVTVMPQDLLLVRNLLSLFNVNI